MATFQSFFHALALVLGQDDPRWALQELGTDEYVLPTRGSDWFDGANYQKFHHHEYTEDMARIETGWTNFAMGVALAGRGGRLERGGFQ